MTNKLIDYHYCATCEHFEVIKHSVSTGTCQTSHTSQKPQTSQKSHQSRTTYRCSRLGYETKPKYQFKCWSPKQNVKKIMKKRNIDDIL